MRKKSAEDSAAAALNIAALDDQRADYPDRLEQRPAAAPGALSFISRRGGPATCQPSCGVSFFVHSAAASRPPDRPYKRIPLPLWAKVLLRPLRRRRSAAAIGIAQAEKAPSDRSSRQLRPIGPANKCVNHLQASARRLAGRAPTKQSHVRRPGGGRSR
jgi:hypothetical protein